MSQIRAGFPDRPVALFGPGTDSGTFDYFTLAIVGTESSSRRDYTKSEDDAVLVNGVAGNADALGYFGYAYYRANEGKLRAVSIDNGQGCVAPSAKTVADNTYQPLTRPMFIYLNTAAARRAEVAALAQFYVAPENAHYAQDLGYVPLPAATLLSVARRLDKGMTGSIFGGHGSVLGVTAETFQDDDRVKSALVR